MQPAMHVRVVIGVMAADGIDHRGRLLRRGGVVEIDQRTPVHALPQRGKVAADPFHVEGRVHCFRSLRAAAHLRYHR